MIRWICCPPIPMIRLWYWSGTWNEIDAGISKFSNAMDRGGMGKEDDDIKVDNVICRTPARNAQSLAYSASYKL
jgi:hypothetical protein